MTYFSGHMHFKITYNSKLKVKQYKQITETKINKTEIKILANPGLA